MKSRPTGAFRASFILFSTIVGAGIFGLPAVVQVSGYAVGLFWMTVLAAGVTLTHLLFAEVVMATKEDHRLVGYVGQYLGARARMFEIGATVLGGVGGLLAYLILSGLFARQVLSPVNGFSTSIGVGIAFVFGVVAVVWGPMFFKRIDFWLGLALLAAFLLLIGRSAEGFLVEHLSGVDLSGAFLPFGVVLYAYGGLTAVAELRAFTDGTATALRKSVVGGTLMAATLTILFVTTTLAAVGPTVTEEAVESLNLRFGGAIPLVGAAAGFLAVLTSYVVFTSYLKNVLVRDFNWRGWLSGLLALGVPMALYLAGIRGFGRILELIGTMLIGLEGIFVILMYLKIRKTAAPEFKRYPLFFIYLLFLAYAGGIFYEVFFRLLRGH